MMNDRLRLPLACACALTMAGPAVAGDYDRDDEKFRGYGGHDRNFVRVATLANYINNDNRDDQTVSEIVAATRNGKQLVYTDSELEQLGFVWIGNPSNPIPTGKLDLPGEPTSVAILGNKYALAAVNTSESFTNASGVLAVVDIDQRSIVAEIPLGGQPDSVAISPDRRYAAVIIENERDEELCVGGTESGSRVPEDGPEEPGDITDDACEAGGGQVGIIPQTAGSPLDTNGNLANPPGLLTIVDLKGNNPKNWTTRDVDLTGIADVAPSDPEPEFVDINRRNEAVVSLQENNYIAIVDLESGEIIRHFSAGTVDLEGIDATEEDSIFLTESLYDVPREPDAIAWVGDLIGTANEGDMFGGSRGFSLFSKRGHVVFDSGNDYEEIAVQYGHYPEGRSENKGSEPESIEYAEFGREQLVFVGSERGSFIAVYEMQGRDEEPQFRQVLPGPLGPEGLLAIPGRNLLIASGEEDDPEFGVRSSIMIYEYRNSRPTYPQLVSERVNGKPIPWSAMSGMVASGDDTILAVWDSFYADSRIFTIRMPDHHGGPAKVVDSLTFAGGSGNFDPEGIAIAPDGSGYWVASEGNASDSRQNRLLHVDFAGTVMKEVTLPAEILACRQAERDIDGNTGTHGSGFEGVAVLGEEGGYRLLVAQQRGWDYTTEDCEELDDDPDGSNPSQPAYTRIWIYEPASGEWDWVPWELAPIPDNASWSGLSEITDAGDGNYVVIERDNRTGDFAELKTLVRVSVDELMDGVAADEKDVFDVQPALEATNGWISDKPEGVAVMPDGSVYLVTDNDGVDDWSGESWFVDLGNVRKLFGDKRNYRRR